MNIDDATKASEFALAIIGVIVALAAGIRKIYLTARKVDMTLQAVERMEKQLFPNGGGTLRDAVDRVEKSNKDLAARIGVVEGFVQRQEASRSPAEAA